MPKFSIEIDRSYRKIADQATVIRESLRETVHPPEKRATTRNLFSIGLTTLAGVALIALLWR